MFLTLIRSKHMTGYQLRTVVFTDQLFSEGSDFSLSPSGSPWSVVFSREWEMPSQNVEPICPRVDPDHLHAESDPPSLATAFSGISNDLHWHNEDLRRWPGEIWIDGSRLKRVAIDWCSAVFVGPSWNAGKGATPVLVTIFADDGADASILEG